MKSKKFNKLISKAYKMPIGDLYRTAFRTENPKIRGILWDIYYKRMDKLRKG